MNKNGLLNFISIISFCFGRAVFLYNPKYVTAAAFVPYSDKSMCVLCIASFTYNLEYSIDS